MAKNSNLISIYTHQAEAKRFERMLKLLKMQGYKFISLDELMDCYRDKLAFGKEKLCFISLDDGFASNLNLVDVCEKYQAPLTIFVSTRPLDKGNYWWRYVYEFSKDDLFTANALKLPYEEFCQLVEQAEKEHQLPRVAMTLEQVKQISKHSLITIGSHTVTHTSLPQMPENVLKSELEDSKRILENLTGKPCNAFSYPNGLFTPRDVEIVRKVYDIAFSVEQRKPQPNDDLMLVPRISVTCDPLRDQLKICGVWPWIKKCYLMFSGGNK